MTGTINIQNLRNLNSLHFEIPDRGVTLLTGSNGSGKTSLLACLRRIGHSNAFPIHFPTSLRSDRLDNQSEGTITYKINDESVEYAYRGERWTPRPRKNANLFDRFGYPSVTYIGASAERFTPRPEDFDTQHIRGADNGIKTAANQIFETEKFSKLRSINLSRGAGNDAFVLALNTTPQTYHSEKHFSLGELCVLKLLRLLTNVANNSMIIVDELEMALHPRAQVNLLRFLENEARNKSLTIIFSTHSVTLLKSVERKRIIYLEKQDNGEVKPIYGCFPTYALGNIASDEETLPDILLYVEDTFARDALTAFFEMFADERFDDPTQRPTVKAVPVGGFKEVISFLERNRSVMPQHVVQIAVLDDDVRTETLVQWNANNNHAQLEKIQRLARNISYLPFTPEVGLITFILENQAVFEQALRLRFSDNQIRIGQILAEYDSTLIGPDQRRAAKSTVRSLLGYIEQRSQSSPDAVRERVCGVFAKTSWQKNRPDFMQLFSPMIS
jgi:ABC-type lipoprotein export system ATPase subunit